MNKRRFCAIGIFIYILALSYGQQLPVKDELYTELREKGFVRQTFQGGKTVSLDLVPNTEFSKKAASSWTSNQKPNIVSENLFLVRKEELKAKSKNPDNVDFSINKVSQIVRSISKMEGMQYYSAGDKKWETLYHQAYTCASIKEKKKPISDVLEGSANGLKIFAFLEDNSFGKSVYSVEYFQNETEIEFTLTNAESWSYAFIKALDPESVKISMVVIDNDDSYLVYMLLQAKHREIPLLGDRIQRSLANRIDAIYNWFTYQF